MINKTKASIYTMGISLLNSVLAVCFSLVYNKYIIKVYGSEMNGLISTLTQFVSLFAIIEGGFTTAAVVATYKPIVNKDYDKLNNILYTTKITYLKIGSLITISVLITGSIYINFISSPVAYWQTFGLLLISVLVTASSICFQSKYTVLIQGFNKEYVITIIALLCKTLTWGISILLMAFYANIMVVYSVNILNVLLNIFLCKAFEKKNYPFVTYKGKYDKRYIEGTRDVLFQKIANTIFTSTDLVLISTFLSLSLASVYNVYFQVYKSILTLLLAFAQAPFNSFGLLAKEEKNNEKLDSYFNIYNQIVLLLSTVTLVTTSIMILPFVKVYTSNITDYNYVYSSLAPLFFSQVYAQIMNRPFGVILNATGNFKIQNIQCGIATVVNILISLAFIKPLGLNSIILGSFIGTMVILVMNVVQTYRLVLSSSCKKNVIKILLNYLLSLLLILLSFQLDFNLYNYMGLILASIITFILSSCIILAVNYIVDSNITIESFKFVFAIIRHRI